MLRLCNGSCGVEALPCIRFLQTNKRPGVNAPRKSAYPTTAGIKWSWFRILHSARAVSETRITAGQRLLFRDLPRYRAALPVADRNRGGVDRCQMLPDPCLVRRASAH